MESLEGKVAVVTGGSSGIGLGIARRLAVNGAKVVVVGRNAETVTEVADVIGGIGVCADVTDAAALRSVADTALQAFGQVDILVNNAGIGPTGRLSGMTAADWQWLLQTNVWSIINGLDVFLPILRNNRDGGHIVNTSSVSGMFTAPEIGGYATTKYAVAAISETLVAELAQEGSQIGVSLFLPGPVRSNIHASSRNRPDAETSSGLHDTRLEDADAFRGVEIPWMEPDDAGNLVVEAILNKRFYVWTHPDGAKPILDRFKRIEASIEESRAIVANCRQIGR